jgi:hypothetical protein
LVAKGVLRILRGQLERKEKRREEGRRKKRVYQFKILRGGPLLY